VERVGYEFGVFDAGTDTLTVYPLTAAVGDRMIALITWAISGIAEPVPPAGWSELVRQSTATHTWAVFAFDVVETLTATTLVWTAATTVTAGAVVVYRGGQPALVEYADPLAVSDSTAVVQHPWPTLPEGTTQGSDRLFTVQWILNVAATVTPADPGATFNGDVEMLGLSVFYAADGSLVAFEGCPATIEEDGFGPQSDTDVASNSTTATVMIRARALVRATAVSDAVPGHIGLLP